MRQTSLLHGYQLWSSLVLTFLMGSLLSSASTKFPVHLEEISAHHGYLDAAEASLKEMETHRLRAWDYRDSAKTWKERLEGGDEHPVNTLPGARQQAENQYTMYRDKARYHEGKVAVFKAQFDKQTAEATKMKRRFEHQDVARLGQAAQQYLNGAPARKQGSPEQQGASGHLVKPLLHNGAGHHR